jgi:hypothetical protein
MARHRSSIHKKDDFAAHPKPSAEPFQPRPFADPAVEETTHSLANNAPSILDKLVALPARSAPIQPKLTIGAPGDKYEQEADRVASQVVRQIHAPQTNAPVQRESIEDDELQMKPDSLQRESIEDEDELQMRPATEAVEGGSASKDLEAAIHQARGSGQALDPSLQRQMGQALGADFSGVTIHTDSQSDQLNRSIQAKAFTTGQDIFFRQGAYQPSSQSGQELIAHELTHVVQQSATPSASNLHRASEGVIQRNKNKGNKGGNKKQQQEKDKERRKQQEQQKQQRQRENFERQEAEKRPSREKRAERGARREEAQREIQQRASTEAQNYMRLIQNAKTQVLQAREQAIRNGQDVDAVSRINAGTNSGLAPIPGGTNNAIPLRITAEGVTARDVLAHCNPAPDTSDSGNFKFRFDHSGYSNILIHGT